MIPTYDGSPSSKIAHKAIFHHPWSSVWNIPFFNRVIPDELWLILIDRLCSCKEFYEESWCLFSHEFVIWYPLSRVTLWNSWLWFNQPVLFLSVFCHVKVARGQIVLCIPFLKWEAGYTRQWPSFTGLIYTKGISFDNLVVKDGRKRDSKYIYPITYQQWLVGPYTHIPVSHYKMW